MNPEIIRRLLLRDLAGLRAQVAAFPDDDALWTRAGGMSNAPGNLALHVAGNLRHFIGHVLGGPQYQRDRAAEFAAKHGSRADLDRELELAAVAVDTTLRRLDPARLEEPYPLRFGEIELGTGLFLAHLCGHLAYHLGQVDAQRRISTGQGALAGLQGFSALAG